ncbi:hypothetical protein, partial [Bacillus sp. EB600]|uniref:hypothetical protein n=1 Tax=Bacillus sp. EB600 TaxID=2806345 RepID=UPI00210D9197
ILLQIAAAQKEKKKRFFARLFGNRKDKFLCKLIGIIYWINIGILIMVGVICLLGKCCGSTVFTYAP